MRIFFVLMATTALAACGGGGGAQTAGSNVAVGGGAGVGVGGTSTSSDPYTQFATPTVAKTYGGVGASQSMDHLSEDLDNVRQQAFIYAGNASTVRDSKISITYDPRDAIFTLKVTDPLSGANAQTRFQDPGSRTNFGGAKEPQWGVPNLAAFAGIGANADIKYLQAGDGDPLSPYSASGTGRVDPGTNTLQPDGLAGSSYQSATLFYEQPGSAGKTSYVSFAGYVRNAFSWSEETVDVDGNPATPGVLSHKAKSHLERGAFAYGMMSDNNVVPTSGTATFTGGLLATMVNNPTLDGQYGSLLPTYFQWISGTSSAAINFGTGAVSLTLNGIVGQAYFERYTGPDIVAIPAGSTFTAAGTANINLVNTGGFKGAFQSASFGTTNLGAPGAVAIAGSSLDGAFFGPTASEIGGGFRIVGGTPDQRIDIQGAFTGKKTP